MVKVFIPRGLPLVGLEPLADFNHPNGKFGGAYLDRDAQHCDRPLHRHFMRRGLPLASA
jgi:hypothetical protein